MIDYITTDGRLIMSADDDCCSVHLKDDVITFADGSVFVVLQRTWLYEEAGVTIVNPLEPGKYSTGIKAKMQIVLQEVDFSAGPKLLS